MTAGPFSQSDPNRIGRDSESGSTIPASFSLSDWNAPGDWFSVNDCGIPSFSRSRLSTIVCDGALVASRRVQSRHHIIFIT